MHRTIILYGVVLAILTALLKYIEYRFWLRDASLDMAFGVMAVIFTGLGIWAGQKLMRHKRVVITTEFILDTEELERRGISKREYEVLQLMAEGMSNQEIAERLFVSLNTVKTHSTNLFAKLGVRRRTEAIRRAKELRLLP